VLPWLITTTAGPSLTAHVAVATAGVAADPVFLAAVTAAVLGCAVALRRCRPARKRTAGRPAHAPARLTPPRR
jgi:hypothetical protein